jgi:hypothetical protein
MARFKPGHSGNPAGRPRGGPDRRTTLLRELEVDLPALLAIAKEQALSGDTRALRLLLDRLLPLRRATSEPVELPELAEAGTLPEKADAVLRAIADARLPPDVGAQLVGALGVAARVQEVAELRERLEAIERVLRGRTT